MASRYRSLSKPAFNLLKSTISPKSTPKISPSIRISTSSPSFPRFLSPLGALQSLLPLHSAVSSARLTSCLGIDSTSSRSLSQVLGLIVPRKSDSRNLEADEIQSFQPVGNGSLVFLSLQEQITEILV